MISQDDAEDHDSPLEELVPQMPVTARGRKIAAAIVEPVTISCLPFVRKPHLPRRREFFARLARKLQTKETADENLSSCYVTNRSIALCGFVRPKPAVPSAARSAPPAPSSSAGDSGSRLRSRLRSHRRKSGTGRGCTQNCPRKRDPGAVDKNHRCQEGQAGRSSRGQGHDGSESK